MYSRVAAAFRARAKAGLMEMALAERTLGRYRVIREVEQRGVESVFDAVADGAPVRLHAIPAGLLTISDDVVVQAAKATALRHINIVAVSEVAVVGSQCLYAVSATSGVSVEKLLTDVREQRVPVPPAAALYIAREVANAIEYAHVHRDAASRVEPIVHGPLRASGVFVSPVDGGVGLSDFGWARILDGQPAAAAALRGAYFSPEAGSAGEWSQAADLFVVGALLYELLTLRRVAPEEPSDARAALKTFVPAPASAVRGKLPPEVDTVLLAALAADPAERPPDAGRLQRGLSKALYTVAPFYTGADLARFMGGLADGTLRAEAEKRDAARPRKQKTPTIREEARPAMPPLPSFPNWDKPVPGPATAGVPPAGAEGFDEPRAETQIMVGVTLPPAVANIQETPLTDRMHDTPPQAWAALSARIENPESLADSITDRFYENPSTARAREVAPPPQESTPEVELEASPSYPSSAWASDSVPSGSVDDSNALDQSDESFGSPRRGKRIALIALSIALLGGGGIVVWQMTDDKPKPQAPPVAADNAADDSSGPRTGAAQRRDDARDTRDDGRPGGQVAQVDAGRAVVAAVTTFARAGTGDLARRDARETAQPAAAPDAGKVASLPERDRPRETREVVSPRAKAASEARALVAGRRGRAGLVRARVELPPPRETRGGSGFLTVTSDRWAYVYVDGSKRRITTPVTRMSLKPGSHTVKLHDPNEDLYKEFTIEITAGRTVTKKVFW